MAGRRVPSPSYEGEAWRGSGLGPSCWPCWHSARQFSARLPAPRMARPSSLVSRRFTSSRLLDILVVTVFVIRGARRAHGALSGRPAAVSGVGRPAAFISKLASEMANPATIVPICSAMGFAHVLRLTECDQHLVQLLVRPLRRMRMLLIPGGIAAGYLINTTIVSQAGTAAVLGPILIPLLRAGGLSTAAAGATLLLGSSMGGELFNPGAVEIAKLSELSKLTASDVIARSQGSESLELRRDTRRVLVDLAAVAGCRCVPKEPARNSLGRIEPHVEPARLHLIKALVPLLPILLLSLDAMAGPYSVGRLSRRARPDSGSHVDRHRRGWSDQPQQDGQPGRSLLRRCGLRLYARHLADRRRLDVCGRRSS